MQRVQTLEAQLLPNMAGFAWKRVDAVADEALLEERTMKGKTLFITGGSRGIGLAIALRAAKDGANIAIVAKTDVENPKLPGTIHTAAAECLKAGAAGAIAIKTDIRDQVQVQAAIDKCVATFGGIDILVNNASAINLAPTARVDMKRYDLMHSVNTRGTFLCTKLALPHLKKSSNPHVLNLSPPLNMDAKWFAPHVAYTMAKFGMSMCVLGHAEEFRRHGIAVNGLWPRTTIATAAVGNLLGGEDVMNMSRTPEMMGIAAHYIFTRKSTMATGNFYVDDEVLASEGITLKEMEQFSVVKGGQLAPDFFV